MSQVSFMTQNGEIHLALDLVSDQEGEIRKLNREVFINLRAFF